MPCLNEAETLETVHRQGAGSTCERAGIERRGRDRRQRQHRRLAGDRAQGRRARRRRSPRAATARRSWAASRPRRARTSSWATPTTATTSRTSTCSSRSCATGNDLVMGNRFKGGIQPGAMPFLHRYLGNPVLSFIGRLFFKSDIGDFHCGLRGFRQRPRVAARPADDGHGVRVARWSSSRRCSTSRSPRSRRRSRPTAASRPPHLRTWRDGWRHLRFLLLYSPRWLFVYPGIILIALGLVLGGLIMHGPLAIGARQPRHQLAALRRHRRRRSASRRSMFGLLTRVYGMVAGFLPPRPSLQKLAEQGALERGLVVGLLVFLARDRPWRVGASCAGAAPLRPAGLSRHPAHRDPVGRRDHRRPAESCSAHSS